MKPFHFILISVLVFCTMGAGPCDILDRGGDDAAEDEVDEEVLAACEEKNFSCTHSLDIEVLLAGNEEYQAGTYTFSITAPDESVYTIDCYLPRADAGLDCNNGDLDSLIAWIDIYDYSTMHLHVNGAPHSCVIEVLYNDFQLIKKSIAPDYDLSYPNGEECAPVCYNGEDHVAVAIY